MDYILIITFELIGIGFNVMQNVIKIGDRHPNMGKKEIFQEVWREDWDTLLVSAIVIWANVVVHFTLDYYKAPITQVESYLLYSFAVALVLGYAGQRLAYKWLGSAEKALDKKVTDKLN